MKIEFIECIKFIEFVREIFFVKKIFTLYKLYTLNKLIHCFINLFTFFDVYFEMNRIKNDANTHCI